MGNLRGRRSDGSFLKLPINYSVVTNIDYEHVDYYKNYKNLENSFLKFIEKTHQLENQYFVRIIKIFKRY